MKTIYSFLFLFALASATFAQTIRRVNADATVTGINVYSTIQAAHDASANGDILIVEPGASVGNLNCIKTLTIYGRGYYLDKNPNYSQLPNNGAVSTVGNTNIYSNNCKIMGLYANGITVNGGVSGTTISRNNLTNVSLLTSTGAAIDNTTITQNYMSSILLWPVSTGYISNVTIANNQIRQEINYQGSANYFSSILINQNTLGIGYFINSFNIGSFSTVWSNNIFLKTDITITTGSVINSTFNNNILFGLSTINPGLGTNNIVLANTVGQFVANTGGSQDNDYRVATSSAIKTASSSGGEVGMFGGTAPYIQYGIPAAPAIIKLVNTGIGNSTTPITATVSATSNN
jgi:hypothetical protein